MAYSSIFRAVTDCVNAIPKVPSAAKGLQSIGKWHADNGKILQDFGKSVRVDGTQVYDGSNIILTFHEAYDIARNIDELNNGANHLNVKSNATWTKVYQMANRGIDFIDASGNVVQHRLKTMPCHNCGIVLPFNSIQVDHYMPQAGGEDLYTLKVLRSLGLTEYAPTGGKGNIILGGIAWQVIQPKARPQGDYDHLYTSTPWQKWTTNAKGAAFLSLLQLKGYLPVLQSACKNSTLNLVPLCGECNRAKSDWIRDIA